MEEFQYEYNVSVKDKIKKLEANKAYKQVRLTTVNSLDGKKEERMGAEEEAEESPAVMDVEITQLNSSRLKSDHEDVQENSMKKRNSAGSRNSQSDEEPQLDVKSLLRRFSVGVTQTFRRKSLASTETSTDESFMNQKESNENASENTPKSKPPLLRSTSNYSGHQTTNSKSYNLVYSSNKPEVKESNGKPSEISKSNTKSTDHNAIRSSLSKGNNADFSNKSSVQKSKEISTVTKPKTVFKDANGNEFPIPGIVASKRKSFSAGAAESLDKTDSSAFSDVKLTSVGVSKSISINNANNSKNEKLVEETSEIRKEVKPKPKARILTTSYVYDEPRRSFSEIIVSNDSPPISPQPKSRLKNSQNKIKQKSISIDANLHSASVLVLGPERGGKSSIVNFLLKQDLSTVSKTPPTNRDIVECIANVSEPEFESVKIIDTPAFNNNDEDACLLSTLMSNYGNSSTTSEDRVSTLVLIVVKFEEHKNYVDCQELINFLKVLSHYQQNLCDPDFSNLLFTITHSTPQKHHSIQGAFQELSETIRLYTSISNPVIAFHALTHNGEKLDNNQENSSNSVALIPTIRSLLLRKQNEKHSNGYDILQIAFGSNYPDSFRQCFVSKRIPLKTCQHPETIRIQKSLQNIYLNMEIEPTEISTLLEIGWENVDSKLRQKYPSSLLTLQQIFQKYRIRNFSEIPEEPYKVLDILKQIPQHNPAITDLLGETLQLNVPSCYPALYIGQGYDVSKDQVTQTSPFQFSGTLKTSAVGLIPEEIGCKLLDDREIVFKFFYAYQDYVLDRLKDLSIKYVTFPTNNQQDSTNQRIGYNVIKPNQEPTKTTTATAMIEYRIFQLGLSKGEEVEFKPQFWDTLSSLPDLDVKKLDTVDCWKEFFNFWGTHVVKSANAGGSIQVNFRGKMLTNIFKSLRQDSVLPSDEYETSKVFQWITGDGLDFVITNKDLKAEFLQGCDVDTNFQGGDMRFQQTDLTKLPYEKVSAVRDEWIQSLILNPVILETNLTLIPISYFVREKSEGIATKMDVAFHHFYSNFMGTQGKHCVIL